MCFGRNFRGRHHTALVFGKNRFCQVKNMSLVKLFSLLTVFYLTVDLLNRLYQAVSISFTVNRFLLIYSSELLEFPTCTRGHVTRLFGILIFKILPLRDSHIGFKFPLRKYPARSQGFKSPGGNLKFQKKIYLLRISIDVECFTMACLSSRRV